MKSEISEHPKLIGESIFLLSEHIIGDMTARYITDSSGQVGLWLYPTALSHLLASRRATLSNESWVREGANTRPAILVEPLVHLKLSSDNPPDEFGQGRTMRWAPTNDRFRLIEQRYDSDSVLTILGDDSGLKIEHCLMAGPEKQTLQSETKFINESHQPVCLEFITSFALSGLTPFASDDAEGRLVVHRFRSVWSAEGRLVSESIENLHLERTWAGCTHLSERFGQVGSMPVRGWFPTALVEDTKAGVVWGARLASPTSWQMEVGRRHDDISLSGGLADYEFGHWRKTVKPGESFVTPTAWLTCTAGSVDEACARLVSVDMPAADLLPEIEQDLPIIYNDWCTSWGNPQENQILAIAKKAAPLGIRYMVIDAGWYMPDAKDSKWSTSFGDWIANKDRFPHGLAAAADAIRACGMIPGLWCEPEHVAVDSDAFKETKHMLTRNGQPLTIGVRRAWDLNDPEAVSYINDRVVGLLKEAGFGYLKWDYSETLGVGVDHEDGLGEGLRRQGEGIITLFDHVKASMPELVIELCSAGGHRLEASLLQRTAMSSFSDAHEVVEIPIVAAALHRLILPRQSQIWASLNAKDEQKRLEYTLASTFLGRMCLSGDILSLNEEQMVIVTAAIHLYQQAVPVIKKGKSRLIEERGASWRHPSGWQAVIRTSGCQGMIVLHTFENSPSKITIQLPNDKWEISASLTTLPGIIQDSTLSIESMPDFSGQVFLIKQKEG